MASEDSSEDSSAIVHRSAAFAQPGKSLAGLESCIVSLMRDKKILISSLFKGDS